MVEGGGASSHCLTWGFSQVVLVSGAHVCKSVNLGCHKVTAKSQLAYLLFFF